MSGLSLVWIIISVQNTDLVDEVFEILKVPGLRGGEFPLYAASSSMDQGYLLLTSVLTNAQPWLAILSGTVIHSLLTAHPGIF